jgi:uncharacterized membrane protein
MNETKLYLLSVESLLVSFYAVVVSLVLTSPAYGYLDAGTISIFFQGLLGGIAVAIASVSIFWRKIRIFLFRNKNEEIREDQADEQESE